MSILIDSYSESNRDVALVISSSYSYSNSGLSFTAVAGRLESVKFYICKNGSPTGNVYVKIYAHTGTYGTSSRGTGDALATSDAVDISTLTTLWDFQLKEFTFSGANKIALTDGYYVALLVYEGGSSGNYLSCGQDYSSPTHSGNKCRITSGTSWTYDAGVDTPFYIYETTIPTVTSSLCTSISYTTATGNGNITVTGGENATRRGFCYKTGTTGDPTTADSTAYDDGSFSTGAFTKGLTGLTQGENYRVRAYAVNSVGTSYGTTVQLTMLQAGAPELATTAATNILYESVTLGGNVTDVGTPELTERGVTVWEDGEEAVDYSVSGTSGVFTKDMVGLTPNTFYYFKAYATNTEGTSYGDTLSFTTAEVTPVVGQVYAIPVFRKS